MLLTGMGWENLVPKTSKKKSGVGTNPILAGLTRLWKDSVLLLHCVIGLSPAERAQLPWSWHLGLS